MNISDLKVVILAGGRGTRLTEETSSRPKPMVEIGGRPILWHIMKIYSQYGANDFIICLGYKGYMIKEYFANYFLHMSDVTFNMRENRMEILRRTAEPWRVTLIDTGENTQTGGRLKRVLPHVGAAETFALTYGDGVADLDLPGDDLGLGQALARVGQEVLSHVGSSQNSSERSTASRTRSRSGRYSSSIRDGG
jgi:glucose-1-phosphate cytidylyltransferase